MYKKHSKCSLVTVLSFLFIWIAVAHAFDEKTGRYTVQDIEANLQDNSILLVLKGDSAPAYTQYELFSPTRLVLDIADAELEEHIDIATVLPENDFAALHVTMLRDKTPQITRFEITLAESHTYKVDRVGNNLAIRLIPKNEDNFAAVQEPITLHDIVVHNKNKQTEILLQASKPIDDFRQDTVTGRENIHDSMYVDINNVDGSELAREKEIGLSVDKIRVATRGSGVRIVFDSARQELFAYDIKTVPQGLLVTIQDGTAVKPVVSSVENDIIIPPEDTPASVVASDPTLDALIDSSEAVIHSEAKVTASNAAVAEDMQDSFGFSGYKAKRISVDFFKIDLHNVFRLFRQISDVNLIVDESVHGSLTLALHDVPWDFALDIILNLKDLKKEERHNTIVIYPAKKVFAWPERANDNLSFEADTDVIAEEALIIQQSTNQPAEIMQAKELLRRAAVEAKNDDIEDAAGLYEEAFKLWPQNTKISNKLAALYLVNLGLNAKAVHFAKETLALDKKNYHAALYAAIASANMDKVADAMDFFSQSISGEPPLKEALISYAAFSEQKNQPEAALKLLNRYTDVYSDTVETMTSKARLYDTMGQTAKATEQYKTLLYSGYQLVPDLKKYIRGRLSMNSNQLSN
jgi:type IV pilus assembly protein PilQ